MTSTQNTTTSTHHMSAEELERHWQQDPRWADVRRAHTGADVVALRGSLPEQHTLAEHGAARLWELLHGDEPVRALGAMTGGQAVQMVKAGLQAVYLSGWQVAADANLSGHTYPDQSLYPANSVPTVVRRLNNAMQRHDQILVSEGEEPDPSRILPIVADAEAGFGGALNAYELMAAMVESGAAGVHFEDQLASEKKCGHMGGKVLVPTSQHVRTLHAARLAADVAGVPSLVVARTDALAANLLTTDVDDDDRRFLTGERTAEGFHRVKEGMGPVIARANAYAPFCDVLWMETGTPDLDQAREFAEAVQREHPDKVLAYNCSPSFNWRRHLDESAIAKFQRELAAMGYRFQFITLAGFHALNHSMYMLATDYAERDMTAFVDLQEAEFAAEEKGYSATRHQREVGAGYFDRIALAVDPQASTGAMAGSTESSQFG